MTKAKRFKWWIPLLCLGVLLVLAGIGLFLWNRPLSLAYDEAESATVRNGNNGDEVILTGEDLEALLEDLRASRFIHRRPSLLSRGGWAYIIELYGSDKRLYTITVLSEVSIKYEDWYYTCEPGLDTDFLSGLFTRNQPVSS